MIVEVYAADSLVTGVEMYEAMLDKVVDIGYVTTSQISPKIRDLTMLEIPDFMIQPTLTLTILTIQLRLDRMWKRFMMQTWNGVFI